jgi:formylglycine-generating enzyme required for sulfatase activity
MNSRNLGWELPPLGLNFEDGESLVAEDINKIAKYITDLKLLIDMLKADYDNLQEQLKQQKEETKTILQYIETFKQDIETLKQNLAANRDNSQTEIGKLKFELKLFQPKLDSVEAKLESIDSVLRERLEKEGDSYRDTLDFKSAIASITQDIEGLKQNLATNGNNNQTEIQKLQNELKSLQPKLDLLQKKLESNTKIELISSVLRERLEKEGDSYRDTLDFKSAIASYEKARDLGSNTANAKINEVSNLPKNIEFKLSEGVTMEFVPILAGVFQMGGDNDQREQPKHQVNIKQFWMGKYPVTQAQWDAIMTNNNSSTGIDFPVNNISWHQAVEFCKKLSEITWKKFRLPSEAEWEYACRAGSQTSYCFGEYSNQLREYAWYINNSNNQTLRVGQKKPNAWGLYDMHGNVWEWCEDNWHDNYEGAPSDGRAWLGNDAYSVLRGGCWNLNAVTCSCTFRLRSWRAYDHYSYGFRIVAPCF